MIKKKEVIKHSAAVQISNKMTLIQHKSWNVLLANAFDDFYEKDLFTISIRELKGDIEYTSYDNIYLQECIEALCKIYVKWNLLGKDKEYKWGVLPLLAGATIENGILEYSYSPTLRKQFCNPKMYVRINLAIQNNFTCNHALSLFELVLDYFDIKRGCGETPWIDLPTAREFLATGIGRDNFCHLKKFWSDNNDYN